MLEKSVGMPDRPSWPDPAPPRKTNQLIFLRPNFVISTQFTRFQRLQNFFNSIGGKPTLVSKVVLRLRCKNDARLEQRPSRRSRNS